MLKHYQRVINSLSLKDTDRAYLLEVGQYLILDQESRWSQILAIYNGHNHKMVAIEKDLVSLSEEKSISLYTVNFLFLVLRSEEMLDDYRKQGYSDGLFFDTIKDLKAKLEECRQVKGVLGNFVPWWYATFFELKLFKLGRLEYEEITYHGPKLVLEGVAVEPGMLVYSVHIPSGEALSKSLREISYKMAYDFFHDDGPAQPMICYCNSWLMWPKLLELLPAHLNLVDFIKEWTIYDTNEVEGFPDAWRVFGKDYRDQGDQMPRQTSLQRALDDWLKKVGRTGEGKGIKLVRP